MPVSLCPFCGTPLIISKYTKGSGKPIYCTPICAEFDEMRDEENRLEHTEEIQLAPD